MPMPANVRNAMNRWVAYLVVQGIGGLWLLSKVIPVEIDPIGIRLFILGVMVYFGLGSLVTAVGLLFKKRWAYYSWKLYLYLMISSWPFGTAIARKAFKFIKEENVSSFY